jgi:hypothetical protein
MLCTSIAENWQNYFQNKKLPVNAELRNSPIFLSEFAFIGK